MADFGHSTRRALLKFIPGAAAVSVVPVAAAVAAESPVAKVNRLAEELSYALADYADGEMHAKVFPASKPYGGVHLVVTNLEIPPLASFKAAVEQAKIKMSHAYPDKDIRQFTTIEGDNAVVILMTEVA